MHADFNAYFVLLILVIIFILIYLEILRPALSFLIAVLIFMIMGILGTEEVLAGFSNTSIVSIILLIILTAGLRKNFQLELLFDLIFKKSKTYRSFLIRMMSQVAIISSFINNTPVVALMIPYVFNYGRRNGIEPSKLLIPLSYATIMGGMITLIGTSTTLVLNGFMKDATQQELKFNDLFILGLGVTITGILFIAFLGNHLLPSRKDSLQQFTTNIRQYLLETCLIPKSVLIGKSVKEAGLRNLQGVYLVEIMRNGKFITPVSPEEIIEKEDILFFAGDTENIMDLINTEKGIILPDKGSDYHQDKINVVEAVVSGSTPIIGRTVKEIDFRSRYDAAIIALHRNGEKISGKIGEIIIQAGDVLLMYAGKDFQKWIDVNRDMYVINKVREISRPGSKKYYALGLILFLVFILFLTKGLTLFPSLLIIFTIMVIFGLISLEDIRREVDFNLIGILVLSLAIGQAMILSGSGHLVAGWIMDLLSPYGSISILIGIILITSLLTQFIMNVGAISITFPIALSLSQEMHMDAMPFFLGICYAASGAFLTPIGYQTNMMIFGPGGYRFLDFFKIGIPVTILYLSVSILGILLIYHDVFF